MPVSASSFARDSYAQANGSFWVREIHMHPAGSVEFTYLAPPGWAEAECQAALDARVPVINASLVEGAFQTAITEDASPDRSELPLPVFGKRLREHFASADAQEKCRMCWWFVRRVEAGDVTQEECRLALGFAVEDWDAVWNGTVIPCAQAWTSVLAATGE